MDVVAYNDHIRLHTPGDLPAWAICELCMASEASSCCALLAERCWG